MNKLINRYTENIHYCFLSNSKLTLVHEGERYFIFNKRQFFLIFIVGKNGGTLLKNIDGRNIRE